MTEHEISQLRNLANRMEQIGTDNNNPIIWLIYNTFPAVGLNRTSFIELLRGYSGEVISNKDGSSI
jgi:hypothetical protein